MTTNSSGGTTKKSKVSWLFSFPSALILWTLGILTIIASRSFLAIAPMSELISPERIPYLLTFIGTILGAIGATSKEGEPVTSRRRDRLALWGWAAISVGSFGALLF